MVKRLYQNGVDIEIIANSANITVEEVKKILELTKED